jgi:hypothetical protein
MKPLIDQAAVQPAPADEHIHYERRRPEETTLYQLVQENVETFFAQVEAETGTGLPDFVKDEFEAFLDCGILANGFLRLRCPDCAHEKLVGEPRPNVQWTFAAWRTTGQDVRAGGW